jgi:hypothetical protein
MFSVVSMVLSVLATRPNITTGKFTKEDVEERRVNLLFFGNFHQMGPEGVPVGLYRNWSRTRTTSTPPSRKTSTI